MKSATSNSHFPHELALLWYAHSRKWGNNGGQFPLFTGKFLKFVVVGQPPSYSHLYAFSLQEVHAQINSFFCQWSWALLFYGDAIDVSLGPRRSAI